MMRPLGSLTADDLGAVVTVMDGGATYVGNLVSVQHQLNLRDEATTFWHMKSGSWSAMKTMLATIVIDVEPLVDDLTGPAS
jgi:hypothetical protein